MNLERIKQLLDRRVDDDIDALYADFAQANQARAEDADAFLAHLSNTGVVDALTASEVKAFSEMEVTDFDGLSPRMSRTFSGLVESVQGEFATDATLAVEDEGYETTDEAVEGAGFAVSSPVDGRYDLVGMVGEGGMGVVHLAKDLDLRRRVAFKRLPAKSAKHRLRARRFLNEVQITAQLDHPNVVPVYSFDIAPDGSPAYAMKLIHGRTFREMLDEARRRARKDEPPLEDNGLDDRLEVIIKICDALAYAHDKGVIHRDLKPANVMIGRFGEVYVMDWGLARLVDSGGDEDEALDAMESVDLEDVDDPAARTRVGAVVGTPAWMAPEQASGDLQALGPWSDVYALGLMLYESVLLKEPYGDRNIFQILVAAERAEREEEDHDGYGKRAPTDLLAIINKATVAEPSQRYRDATELGADLRRYRANEETSALPDNLPRKLRRWIESNPRKVATGVALLVVVFLALGVWQSWTDQLKEAERREQAARTEHALTTFMGSVAQQAQRVDNHFLFYEATLEGLASTAEQALANGLRDDSPAYELAVWESDTPPPGTERAASYDGKMVNPNVGMHLAPLDTPRSEWEPQVPILQSLLPTFYDIFRTNPDGTVIRSSREALREQILQGTPPIAWAYVSLENTGIVYMYPGADGFDHGYDARERPFYKVGKQMYLEGQEDGNNGVRERRGWSPPYEDLMGIGRIISAVQPLESQGGEFLGVATLDLALSYVVENHLIPDNQDGFVGAWLVDQDGVVLMKTLDSEDPFAADADESDKYNRIDFGPFLHVEVRDRIINGESGHMRVQDSGAEADFQNLVLGWSRLEHLGWTYVMAVELEQR